MDIKKFYGYVIPEKDLGVLYKNLDDTYNPLTVESENWRRQITHVTPNTCEDCENLNGKIYSVYDTDFEQPPIHPNCRCETVKLEAIIAGDATKDAENGADFWIKYYGELPGYYISEQEISDLGWKRGKSPKKFASGKMVTMGTYQNMNGRLPDISGRIWYEADINYYEGKRNKHRLLWSNDGLIFVTYDHYETFYEIV